MTVVGRIIDGSARHRGLVLIGVAFALAAAVWAMRRVEVDAIPDLSDPQVIVFTEWTGRSPMLVEQQVTQPIVAGLRSAPGVRAVRGVSMFGMSFVYVLFGEGTEPYWARSRVQEYLGTLGRGLPAVRWTRLDGYEPNGAGSRRRSRPMASDVLWRWPGSPFGHTSA